MNILPAGCITAIAVAAVTPAQAPTSSPSEEALPTAASLLDRMTSASGDATKRSAMRSLLAKGTVNAAGMGGGKFEEVYLGPDRVCYRVEFEGYGEMTQGTDGTISWSTEGFGTTVRRGDEQGSVPRMFAIGWGAPWRTLYEEAETVRGVELDGKPCFELRMTPRRGNPETWFVDAASHRLTRVDLALPDPMGGEFPCQFLYADWRERDGLWFPFEKRQKAGTYELVFAYDSIEPNAEVAPERVAPSEKVRAAAADPKKQLPKPPDRNGVFTVETVAAKTGASIRLHVKRADIAKTLAVVFPEVIEHITKAGVSPASPPFSRFHSIQGDDVDLEAGIATSKPVAAGGRVQPTELPAGRVAQTWHIGPFETISESCAGLEAWMREQKLEARGGMWEVYWTDPGIEPDPNKWRTQILWPVK